MAKSPKGYEKEKISKREKKKNEKRKRNMERERENVRKALCLVLLVDKGSELVAHPYRKTCTF